MKKITLKQLTFNGFRGKTRTIDFSPSKTVITGHNEVGKSTTHNAYLWLLTGFDNKNRMNYNIFDNKSEDESRRCEVTAVFDVDGTELKLTRKGMQTWSKKRDTGEKYRNGDDYDFFVDDLKVSATKYGQVIRDTFGKVDEIKIMTIPDLYMLLPTRELRKFFAEMAGEVVDSDFKGDYSSVIGLINQSGLDGARKTFSNRLSDLDKSIKNTKAKKEVSQDMLPDMSGIEDIENRLHELEQERAEIEAKRNSISGNDEVIVHKRKEQEDAIFAKKREMEQARLAHDRENDMMVSEREEVIEEAKRNNRTRYNRKKEIKDLIGRYEDNIKASEIRIESLRNEYKTISNRMFDGICPECGAKYTGAKYTEVLNRFSAKKAADFEAVKSEGMAERKRVEDFKAEKEKLQEELDGIKEVAVEPLEKELYEFKKTLRPFDASEYERQISEMEANRVVIPENKELQELLVRLGDVNALIGKLNRKLGVKDTYERGVKNIEQLHRELKSMEQDVEVNTQMKTLVENYQREYAEIIRNRVNVRFNRVVVEMTQPNKSGGLDDVCNLSLDGVANTNNSGGEIIIGCEVCEAFQKFYGVSMPLFIDKIEGLDRDKIPFHDGQVILLERTDGEFEVR